MDLDGNPPSCGQLWVEIFPKTSDYKPTPLTTSTIHARHRELSIAALMISNSCSPLSIRSARLRKPHPQKWWHLLPKWFSIRQPRGQHLSGVDIYVPFLIHKHLHLDLELICMNLGSWHFHRFPCLKGQHSASSSKQLGRSTTWMGSGSISRYPYHQRRLYSQHWMKGILHEAAFIFSWITANIKNLFPRM